jgi:hypothetical protein
LMSDMNSDGLLGFESEQVFHDVCEVGRAAQLFICKSFQDGFGG